MTTKAQAIFDAVQELSPLEQLELIQAISQSLQRRYQQTLPPVAEVKRPDSDPMLRVRRTPAVTDLSKLAADFWPAEETADDVIAFVYQQRREDRLRDE